MQRQRLLSLDVLRGLTVAGMILVNNGYKDSFPMLQHAEWNGLTVSDFVFPFFLFIMGVSLYLSLSKTRFEFSLPVMVKIVKRSVLLFAIGLAINWFDMAIWGDGLSVGELRFWAVLQRIAVCYLITGIFAISCKPVWALPLSVVLIVLYGVVLFTGSGYSQESASNILYRVDACLFGTSHLYHKSAVDPEGLLSTICALVNTLLGFYCAMKMKTSGDLSRKISSVYTLGTLLVMSGFILSFFMPCNKHIWSPSFALVTSGICALLLGVSMKWVDLDRRGGVLTKIFMVFGSNALILYVASELMAIIFGRIGLSSLIYETLSFVIPVPELASLAYALCYVGMNFAIGYPLWKKHIYIKL